MVQSSAALNNGIINYEGNNKKFVPDQTSLSNKRDGNTIKVKLIALSGSFTLVKSLEPRLTTRTRKLVLLLLFLTLIFTYFIKTNYSGSFFKKITNKFLVY